MICAKTHHRLIQPERMFSQEAVKKSDYEDPVQKALESGSGH